MKPKRFLILFVQIAFSGSFWVTAFADDTLPIEPFQARFTIFALGFPAGEGELRLTDLGNGRYLMESTARPNLVFKLLYPVEELRIETRGEVKGGYFLPRRYEEKISGYDVDTTRLRFEWEENQLYTQKGTQHVTLPLRKGVHDPLTMVLVAMQELGKGLRSGVYTLAHETSIKSYQISVAREEYIRTALGYLRTLRVSHRREDGNRETIFWFAPRFDYLLVQAVQRRKKGLRFEFARLAIKETSHTR